VLIGLGAADTEFVVLECTCGRIHIQGSKHT
jgi:hypothetical protein